MAYFLRFIRQPLKFKIMKNYIAILFLAFTFTTVSAADLPKDIVPTTTVYNPEVDLVFNFNSDFPESKALKWSSNQGKVFVEFLNKEKIKSFAVYKNGELIETYYGIDVNNLPTISKSHLNTKLPQYKVEKAYIIQEAGSEEKFLVELKDTDDVIYSKDGYLLRYVK